MVVMHVQHAQKVAECNTTQNTMNIDVVSSFSADHAVVLSAFRVGALSGLQKNKSLKSLCLAACRLGNQGIALLCIYRASWKG